MKYEDLYSQVANRSIDYMINVMLLYSLGIEILIYKDGMWVGIEVNPTWDLEHYDYKPFDNEKYFNEMQKRVVIPNNSFINGN